MSVNITYIASSGNEYNLKAENELRIKEANFHNYEWEIEASENRFGVSIDRFAKAPVIYPVTLMFMGTYDQNRANIEALHSDFERDILTQSPGRLVWGKCYIECYARGSSTYPDENNVWTRNEVEFYCPYPFWIQESFISIPALGQVPLTQGEKKYSYQYDYAYAPGGNDVYVDLGFYGASDFRLVAYGPFGSLFVTMGGNVYNVAYSADPGDAIVIDTRRHGVQKGEVYHVNPIGDKTNLFDYRNPLYPLFASIPAGPFQISYSRDYGIDLTLYHERSEPIQ